MRHNFSKYHFNCLRGFTLIEIVLYVSVSAILLLGVSIFFTVLIRSNLKNQSISEVEQVGVQIIQMITQTVRNAKDINRPDPSDTDDSLSVEVVDEDNDPTVFDLSGSTLRMREGDGSAIALTPAKLEVSALSFQNLSRPDTPGIVRIQFTLSRVNSSNVNEYDYSKTFYASAGVRGVAD